MRSERGSAAIAAVGVVVLGLVLMVGLAGIGQVVLAREKVVAAAEAGALAAAPVTFRPFGATGSPSAEADRLVRANGAVLVRCYCRSDPGYSPRTAIVTARLKLAVLGIREVTLEATAAAEFSPVAVLVEAGSRP
ncbi:MAG: pilus assembly protein TadG-related protein [bacterium]|nr:pilus assembly protein TadG-related protein [bacterium]MDE0288926.1 pilus assembly protein TadG-related protein [bacterium]